MKRIIRLNTIKLVDFLDEYQDEIADSIIRDYPPVYTFNDREKYVDDIKKLKRKPFLCQMDAISALAKLFSTEASGILVGEMGTGKSLISIAIAYVCKFKNVLITMPPHLISKYEREVMITMPEGTAKCHHLKKFTDVDKAVASANDDLYHFFILGRERAKLSYQWRPAFNIKQKIIEIPVADNGNSHIVKRKVILVCCPRCGELIYDKEGIPLGPEDLTKKKTVCANCNEQMWQAKQDGPRRFAVAEYIKRKHKNFFDLLVLDECFPAGIKVKTKYGEKSIEDIKIGEYVLSLDEDGLVYKKVVRVFKKLVTGPLANIKYTDGNLLCTKNHNIYTNRGKIRAGQIQSADIIWRLEECNHEEVCKVWKNTKERECQILFKEMFFIGNNTVSKNDKMQEMWEKHGSLSRGKKKQEILFRRMSTFQKKKISIYKSMQRVWQGYFNNMLIKTKKTFLQSFLFGKMENAASRDETKNSNDGRAKAKNWRKAKDCSATKSGVEEKHIKENEAKQPYETTRNTEKGYRSDERDAFPCRKRRPREGTDRPTSIIGDNTWVADGGYNKDREQKNAILLQCGFGGRNLENCSGVRWDFTQNVKGDCAGPKKRRDFTETWMGCIEIQEQRNYRRHKEGNFRNRRVCPKEVIGVEEVKIAQVYVYNIEVEETHNYFADGVLVSNCHEYRGRSSAQGISAGNLASVCKRSLGLSGTIVGGYSSSIFHLLYRITKRFKDDYKHDGVNSWISDYGILEQITKKSADDYSDNSQSKGKKYVSAPREKPGISPVILPKYLLDKTVFIRLSDIAIDLPPLTEEIVDIEMSAEQEDAYNNLYDDLRIVLLAELQRGNKSLLAVYLQALLTYPDRCTVGEFVYKKTEGEEDLLIASAPALNGDVLYPKEQAIIDLIKSEMKEGRKVLVFCTHTNRRDVTARLQEKIQSFGIRSEILKANVAAEKREAWIKDHVNDLDCLITNPALVQTGLDLVEFPTVAYCQSGYSVYTLRQSSRRSWRIGQDKPVNIYYFVYRATMQEQALKLMALKMKASLIIEGELGEDGLATYNVGNDNLFYELARNIANNISIDGDLETIWKTAQKKKVDGSDLLIEKTDIVPSLNDIVVIPAIKIEEKHELSAWDKLYVAMMQEQEKKQDIMRERREKRERLRPADAHQQIGLF